MPLHTTNLTITLTIRDPTTSNTSKIKKENIPINVTHLPNNILGVLENFLHTLLVVLNSVQHRHCSIPSIILDETYVLKEDFFIIQPKQGTILSNFTTNNGRWVLVNSGGVESISLRSKQPVPENEALKLDYEGLPGQ